MRVGHFILVSIFFFSFFEEMPAQELIPKVSWLDDVRLKLNDDIADVKVDSEGNVWIITFSEIVRYNSNSFTTIYTQNVNHASFLKFRESTSRGKYVYDLNGHIFFIKRDSLVPYSHNSVLIKDKIGQFTVQVQFDSTGGLYHARRWGRSLKITEEGIKEINTEIHSKNTYTALLLQEKGLPLISENTRKKGAKEFGLPEVLIINQQQELVEKFLIKSMTSFFSPSLVEIREKEYLYSTGLGQLIHIKKDGSLKEIPFDPAILNLFVDSKNNLWISTENEGIYFFPNCDFDSKDQFILMKKQTAIINSEDHEGALWGYQEHKGVFRVNNPVFRYLNSSNGYQINNRILDLVIADKGLYISTDKELLNWNPLTKRLYYIPLPANPKNINKDKSAHSLYFDSENKELFLSQRGLLLKYDDTNFKVVETFENIPSGNYSYKVFLAKQISFNKNIVVGCYENFYFFLNLKSQTRFEVPIDDEKLKEVVIQDDCLFIRGNNGLYLYQISSGKLVRLDNRFSELKVTIVDIEVFRNDLWIATKYNGTYVLKKDSLLKVKSGERMINNASIVRQNETSLWLFSETGSYNYSATPKETIDYSTEIIEYTAIPNMVKTVCLGDSFNSYIGTLKYGMLVVNYEQLKKVERNTPILNLEYLKLGNQKFSTTDSVHGAPYKNNTFYVKYNGVSYDISGLNYRYRLIGLDNKWIETVDNALQFNNLDAGEYKFEIQLEKQNHQWSKSKFIGFYILPPFWETWWFILLSIGLLSFIAYHIFNYRLSTINREKTLIIGRLEAEQRALRTKMDPHFVFNIISSLQYLILKKRNDQASTFLNRFSVILRNTLDQTENETTTVAEEVNFLKEYIELEKLRHEDSFNYSIIMANNVDLKIQIPTFLLQPLVENSIKHGFKEVGYPGELTLRFSKKANFLFVEIEDNGVGYSGSLQTQKKSGKKQFNSYGSETVERRLLMHNRDKGVDSFQVIDLLDDSRGETGTKIILKIKIY